MSTLTVCYLEQLGLPIEHHVFTLIPCAESRDVPRSQTDSFHQLQGVDVPVDVFSFTQALDDALASALTKFDAVDAYFSRGQPVGQVSDMICKEVSQDEEVLPLLTKEEDLFAMRKFVRTTIGKLYGEWKKCRGTMDGPRKEARASRGVPLPWSTIEAYPSWVMGQVDNYINAETSDRGEARKRLEEILLTRPVCAAIKYDGTCFGKMDNGDLAGRKDLLGADCPEYQKTSTLASAQCDVASLRCKLEQLAGAKVEQVCVWGELMCNPNFYRYKDRGLADKWVCFGVCLSFAEVDENISRRLAQSGLAYSLSDRKARLMLCPALQKLLMEVGCDVAETPFQGLSHAQIVSSAANSLISGENEGIVFISQRGDGQASLRKWKNSAEGAVARKKEAELLDHYFNVCAELVAGGSLDARVSGMLKALKEVAQADTVPTKRGRRK